MVGSYSGGVRPDLWKGRVAAEGIGTVDMSVKCLGEVLDGRKTI